MQELVGKFDFLLTIGVDYGDDVEVEAVQDSLGFIVTRFVAVDKLQREILNSLGELCQPHSREKERRHPTKVVIHSRACTVPWYRTAGFPGPASPQR